jgi:hypothetical protein
MNVVPMREKESRNKNSGAAFGTIFRICKCFKEEGRNFIKKNSLLKTIYTFKESTV